MRSDACCAQPGSAYQSILGQPYCSLPCEGATLRIGVFQDGTGNSMERPDRYTNVAKLARVYRIDKDLREVRWVYARGVGTNPDLTGDLLGKALGTGGPQRLNGLLHAIQELIAQYERENGSRPTRIVLDAFGFSRGAALIRHFVNCIRQGHFELDGPYRSIPKEAFRIGFLGVFDAVGSFGHPGDDEDRGYTFHVPAHWLEDGGLHLVADDEHRANFDLQAMLQSDPHPQDRTDGMLREIVLPGAHSDIGGGYPSSQTQGQANNQLARIALAQMLEAARKAEVPLDRSVVQSFDERGRWEIDPGLQAEHERLMKYYRDLILRKLHRRWRVLKVALESCERDLRQPNVGNSAMQARQNERERESHEQIRSQIKQTEREMRACFSGLWEYDAFMDLANAFYRDWVHLSHNPHNTALGMQVERRGKYREACQRQVFNKNAVEMAKDRQFRKLAPRPFKDGVWIDEACLAAFQV